MLVIVDEACAPAAFREQAAHRPAEAYVVAPALASRLGRLTGDEDAYEHARRNLAATLRALEEVGIEAHGRLGPHDPLRAADDGLREFPADELVFATSPGGGSNWLEQGVVSGAQDRYGVPVTHVGAAPSS